MTITHSANWSTISLVHGSLLALRLLSPPDYLALAWAAAVLAGPPPCHVEANRCRALFFFFIWNKAVLPEPISPGQLDPAHLLGNDVANDEEKGHQAAQDREECHKEQEHLKC